MKRTTFILLFLVTIIFSSCNSCKQRELSGNNERIKGHISISGAFALYPITVRWAEEFQKEYIIKALAENNWNKTKTAEYLNIERAYFHRKLKDLGINS